MENNGTNKNWKNSTTIIFEKERKRQKVEKITYIEMTTLRQCNEASEC